VPPETNGHSCESETAFVNCNARRLCGGNVALPPMSHRPPHPPQRLVHRIQVEFLRMERPTSPTTEVAEFLMPRLERNTTLLQNAAQVQRDLVESYLLQLRNKRSISRFMARWRIDRRGFDIVNDEKIWQLKGRTSACWIHELRDLPLTNN
jgi:hypothetical protein